MKSKFQMDQFLPHRFLQLHRTLLRLMFVAASVSVMSSNAVAQITADKTIVYWKATQPPVINTTIRNSGNDALLVEMDVFRVENPGTPEETRSPAEDLIVTPKKGAVAANGERLVRMLFKGKRTDHEQVYRLNFVPKEAETDFDRPAAKKNERGSVNLRVLSGVGLLIFIEPLKPFADLQWERLPHEIKFRNAGNVNVLLAMMNVCPKTGAACTPTKGKRLYPGQEFSFPIDATSTLRFRRRVGDEGLDLEIP